MTKRYRTSLMIFRRDLRLADNTALAAALEQSQEVIPCFIFDPRQIEKNPYRSDSAVQFMLESLEDLERQLAAAQGRLCYFWGRPDEVVAALLSAQAIEAVFVNRDYTPFSLKRDKAIAQTVQKQGAAFHQFADLLLHEPEEVLKPNGAPYRVFTPFFQRASQIQLRDPARLPRGQFYTGKIKGALAKPFDRVLPHRSASLFSQGGRTAGLRLLKGVGGLNEYAESRNLPSVRGTTSLSAHHKFGTISIRESYRAVAKLFGERHQLLTEFHWRDFFSHIGYHFPHVFGGAFHQTYDRLPWRDSMADYRHWCNGETGFPIVDAGMRQLAATGWMHNRVRMIVASFLTKDLHLDWRMGERYFATRLIDYDPSVNNGNWQWAASVGCDAAPYFRVLNPWLQQQKFDPEAAYIKQWVPELRGRKPKEIHALDTLTIAPSGYPRPMVDHNREAEMARDMFRRLRKT